MNIATSSLGGIPAYAERSTEEIYSASFQRVSVDAQIEVHYLDQQEQDLGGSQTLVVGSTHQGFKGLSVSGGGSIAVPAGCVGIHAVVKVASVMVGRAGKADGSVQSGSSAYELASVGDVIKWGFVSR